MTAWWARLLRRWIRPARERGAPAPENDGRLAAIEATLQHLDQRVAGLEQRSATHHGPSTDARKVPCKVRGCATAQRARGFCTRHYQAWRRGALAGFVSPDGRIEVADHAFRVDRALAGLPASLEGSTLRVGQRVVDARPVAPRR